MNTSDGNSLETAPTEVLERDRADVEEKLKSFRWMLVVGREEFAGLTISEWLGNGYRILARIDFELSRRAGQAA